MRDGIRVGIVSQVDHLPSQDLIHVTTDAGEVLVPFVKAIVPSVDIQSGTITVTPPDGLFEELPDDDGETKPDAVSAVGESEVEPEVEPGPTSTD